MIIIPQRQTKQIAQINRGNILGDLWSTWNIDLQSNSGAIRVGKKFKLNTGSGTEANLGIPVSFQYFDGRMWALCGDRIFKNSSSDLVSAFTEDASAGFVTTYDKNYADMITFNGVLVASADTKLWRKASNGGGTGAWTEIGVTVLTTATNHQMCYFKKFDRLYVTNNKTDIKSVDTSWTVASSNDYFIDLGDSVGRISTLRASSSSIWIGLIRPTATSEDAIAKASVLEWDGISAQVTREYPIDAQGVLAMVIKDDRPIILDSNGILREFNGSGFVEIGRLPLDREMLTGAISTFNDRFIHPNGMIVSRDNTILCLINNALVDNSGDPGGIKENLPSGIWEWSREHGFVHKHPITYQPMATTTLTDNGQVRISRAGALSNANIYSTSASGRSTLICGAQYFTNASSTAYGIFIDSPMPVTNATTTESAKFGYFVTSWLMSQNLKDTWKKIFARYRKFLNSSDKIVIKYRLTEADPTYIDITWVNTTSFTTSTNVTSYSGYEVEVVQGTGSGKCAHISSVTGSGPYTVNLDETFTGVTTGTAKARLQAWVKASSVSNQTTESAPFMIGIASERIQIKCCMQFTSDDELHELVLINEPNQLLV